VRLRIGEQQLTGLLRDICRDAALVESQRTWPLGTTVALALEPAGDQEAMEVIGTVVRIASVQGEPRGMAVLFSDLAPAAATRIDLLIDQGTT
jgi:hypothetical protein